MALPFGFVFFSVGGDRVGDGKEVWLLACYSESLFISKAFGCPPSTHICSDASAASLHRSDHLDLSALHAVQS